MTTAYKNMSETITAGLMTLADKVVAKRDSRVKFIVKPDKQIANLAAQKNAAARKEVKARRRGQSAGILGHFFFCCCRDVYNRWREKDEGRKGRNIK
jgi:hypothetical protein